MANTNQKLRILLEAERAQNAALRHQIEVAANDYAHLQKQLLKEQNKRTKTIIIVA